MSTFFTCLSLSKSPHFYWANTQKSGCWVVLPFLYLSFCIMPACLFALVLGTPLASCRHVGGVPPCLGTYLGLTLLSVSSKASCNNLLLSYVIFFPCWLIEQFSSWLLWLTMFVQLPAWKFKVVYNGAFSYSHGCYGFLRGLDPSQNLIENLIENAPVKTHVVFLIFFRGFVDLYESHPNVGL